MMKKTILLFITLSAMALAVVFAFTHTYAPQDKILKENVAALADDPITDDEDGSSEEPGGGGGGGWCYKDTWYSPGSAVADCAKNCKVTDNSAAPLKNPKYCR